MTEKQKQRARVDKTAVQYFLDPVLAVRFNAACALAGVDRTAKAAELFARFADEMGIPAHPPAKVSPRRHTSDPKPVAKPATPRKPARRAGKDG